MSNFECDSTLVSDKITQKNVQYVKEHLGDFGNIVAVDIYGLDNVPEQYQVPEIHGSNTYHKTYQLIIENDRGHSWWFAGVACGYTGEGCSGTHEILTLLGIPYSLQKLRGNNEIHIQPQQDHALQLSAVCIDSQTGERTEFARYKADFSDASRRQRFCNVIENLGIVSELPEPTSHITPDEWAQYRNLQIVIRTSLRPDDFRTAFTDILRMVEFNLRADISIIMTGE